MKLPQKRARLFFWKYVP